MTQRIQWLNFDRGLWLSAPQDQMPDGTLYRGKAIHAVPSGSIRLRQGSDLIYTLNAHSIFRFKDQRWLGVGTDLYVDNTIILNGLSGGRLAFARMPPSVADPAKPDYLFVAGGGTLVKFTGEGDPGSYWGLRQRPPDGFTATVQDAQEQQIESFDAGGWTDNGLWSVAPAVSADLQEGAGSISGTVAANKLGKFWKSITSVDLTVYAANSKPSPDEDYIAAWIKVDDPSNLETLEIAFKIDSATFNAAGDATDTFSFQLTPGEIKTRSFGIGSFEDEDSVAQSNNRTSDDLYGSPPTHTSRPATAPDHEEMGQRKLSQHKGTWTHVRIPKAAFERVGDLVAGWDKITGIRVSAKTNNEGAATVWIDDLRLMGGVGMQGNYKYLITFYNPVTGTYSQPNVTPVEANDVDRGGVLLDNLPTFSTDPQATQMVVWRTLGDGAQYFKCAVLDLPIVAPDLPTYLDEVADYFGLHGDAGAYLESTVLNFEILIPPSDTYQDCAGPHQGRMWWARDTADGGAGRVYYSPPGLAEAVKSWVDVTDVDDPIQKIIIWQGALWAFSESSIFQIIGTGEPFAFRAYAGCPGTTKPFTVAATPFGIVYEAADGLRVFDGNESKLAFSEAILPLFRGSTIAGIPPFSGVCGAYGRGEYFISDATNTTLAVSAAGRWRSLGQSCNAIFFEPDTQLLIASFGGSLYSLEAEGALLDGTSPIPFEWETTAARLPRGVDGIVQRLYIDINTHGSTVVPTVVIDGGTQVLGSITNVSRETVEFALSIVAHTVAVRLAGSATSAVELYSIEAEVHTGDESDA